MNKTERIPGVGGITLRQMELFVAVVRGGSLTEGARRCGMTRAAASMSLANLERGVGRELFSRKGRGLLAGELARRLLPGAEALVRGVQDWQAMASAAEGEQAGDLRLGCSLTIGNYCMPALLRQFQEAHPRVKLSLSIMNSREVGETLRAGLLDFGLIESAAVPEGLDSEVWMGDRMVVVASAALAASLGAKPRKAALAGQVWLVRERGSGTREISERFLSRFPVPPRLLEIGGTEAIKGAVEAGLGLALLSLHAVQREVERGDLIALNCGALPKRRFVMLWEPGLGSVGLARVFRQWLAGRRQEAGCRSE